MMATRIRLYTHEVIIHSQIASIEKILDRVVEFEVTLNQKQLKSTIEFAAEDTEISKLKNDLGYNIFVFDGVRWLPHL
jgi:hypothetical protein